MTVRAWARSRSVPASTAYKAVQAGRISRDGDGRVNPEQADREWMENTRPRIDGRVPVAPGSDSGAMVDLQPLSQEALEERYGAPAPDPEETVRVVDALTVEAELEDLLAGQLVAALNRAIVEIAPRLARPTDGGWMSERLYLALDDGWRRTELEWRERHPFDHARTGEDVGSE